MISEIDLKILTLLQENARLSNIHLAKAINMSPSATLERVRRLEEQGYILKYATILDPVKIDREIIALIFIELEYHHSDLIESFRSTVLQIDEILECYHISGQFDYMLKIAVSHINEYEKFVRERLTRVRGIGKINTSFVLRTIKRDFAYNLQKETNHEEIQ